MIDSVVVTKVKSWNIWTEIFNLQVVRAFWSDRVPFA